MLSFIQFDSLNAIRWDSMTYERYGEETLTIDATNKQVIVTRAVEQWTEQEIADAQAAEAARKEARKQEIQPQITSLQAELAALE